MKVCKTIGRYSVEVKVPSLFEDQTTSWIRIVNGVEKYVREAMPIQEEERASTRCKGETIFETVINRQLELYSDETEKMDRHWSEKIQGHFQMPKFITQLLRHEEVGREEDAGVLCDRMTK